MKLSLSLSSITSALALLTPVLGCVHASGEIYIDGYGLLTVESAQVWDNGGLMCDSDWGWRWDQDDHLSLTCVSGYVYAFTDTGTEAWYGYGSNAWSWSQSISASASLCVELLNLYCYTTTWDVYEFC